ncbi:MAG: endonuclease, partial [bacterium]|nr:endonuclease [bacterium]
MSIVRIATFNVENLDETEPGVQPSLAERLVLMPPQVERLRSDIVCFQEVHGQERPGQPRDLLALKELLTGTYLDTPELTLASTKPAGDAVYDKRNLVVASRFPVTAKEQLRYKLVSRPKYRRITAIPAEATAKAIGVERPIQHVQVDLGLFGTLHVINLHLKSKIPTNIEGQKVDDYTWRSADAWAEGLFLSSMKRMSQAVEVRRLVDQLFDADADAKIVVGGDFNAEPHEIPVMA